MSVVIKEVQSKKDRKAFVNLPYQIYKDNKYWVPPLKFDEYHSINPKDNPALRKFKHKFFIAIKNGKVVGRIGAAINHIYNEKVRKNYVRIINPEFYDDKEVFEALIKTVGDFGKKNGMEFIHGPLGFTNLDKQGLLVEGFDYLQAVGSVYHKPYYKEHFERLGFEKENDWLELRVTITEDIIEKSKKLIPLISKRFDLKIEEFTSIEEVKEKFLDSLFEILNSAFQNLPYVIPFDNELKAYYTKKYIDILNPRFIKIMTKNNELAGFTIGMPSLSEALQKAKGHLLPFGIFHIRRALKKPKVVEILLTGTNPKYNKFGTGALVIGLLQLELWKVGGCYFETTGIFETNQAALSNWKQFKEKIQHKRRRVYVKPL